MDSEEGQFQLFDALTSFLRDASGETPLVIVLDDLHWADRSTLRMLTHLAREIAMARLLVVGTYRDTDLDRQHPLSQALAEMNREQLFTRVLLRGLTEPETRAYIEASANVQPSADLVRRIHQETEGNPFFLSEVVSLMAEEGSLAKDSLSGISIPEGVKEALGRRLDRLSPEANELLSVAAVVGRECSHALLAALTEFDDDTLLRLVEEALAARVLEETGAAGEYRFTHALMQDALYAELSTARRVRMHARVAETLESLYDDSLDGRGAELARHFGEAAVMNRALAEKAASFAELAAQQAEEVGAWAEAVGWYRAALDELEGLGGSEHHEGTLWMRLSNCLRVEGRVADGWEAFHRGVAELRRLENPEMVAEGVLAGLQTAGHLQDIVPLRPLFRELLAALPPEPSLLACNLLARLAMTNRFPSGDKDARRAEEMARTLGLTEATQPPQIRMRSDQILLDRGDIAGSVEVYRKRHAAAVAAGATLPPGRAVTGIAGMVNATVQAGQIDEGVLLLEEYFEFCNRRRLGGRRQEVAARLARIALQRNERDTFEHLARTNASRWMSMVAADDALNRGALDEASKLLEEVDQLGPGDLPTRQAIEIQILLHRGKRQDAERLFHEQRASLDATLSVGPLEVIRAFTRTSQAVASLGGHDLIREGYEVLRTASWYRCALYAGEAPDVARGLLALRLGDVDAAERDYRDGLEWARRPDVRFGLVEGRCLQGLADVAEARGDHAPALEHLEAAAAKFAEYGAKLYLDQVLAKKEFLKA